MWVIARSEALKSQEKLKLEEASSMPVNKDKH